MALGFGADCIKIVVSMATDRSHRLTVGKTKKIFFSETFDIWYVAMANGPLHKLCHSCPWGQIWPRPGGSIVSIDLLWGKKIKTLLL